MQKQAAELVHCQLFVGHHQPAVDLMERLSAVLPPELDTMFFPTTGAEAVENAVKLARQATGRPNIVVMSGSFHGRSLGTMPLTTSKTVYRAGFGPFMGGVFVAPFPYCHHCPSQAGLPEGTECCMQPMEGLRNLFMQQTTPAETAAIIVEPIQGEGGYVPMPVEYYRALRAFCTEHDILLVADEVQSGFGRTGHMFASTGIYGVVPDVLVSAKGLASGYTLSMVATKKALTTSQPPGSFGGTYAGNAVASAAAVATLDVIRDEKLAENAVAMGW